MRHFVLDGVRASRPQCDELRLIHELLEDVPARIGVARAMPPFVLPYYDGADPEDGGISAFVFLAGGHFSVHTFSRRRVYFVDLFVTSPFDAPAIEQAVERTLPCETAATAWVARAPLGLPMESADVDVDFGPHLMVDIEGYRGPSDLDTLFELFDRVPFEVGMTPIMRPYAIKARTGTGAAVVSVMTMLAESHVSLHVLPGERRAYFDLFSCRFYDRRPIVELLRRHLPGTRVLDGFVARGRGYRRLRTTTAEWTARSRSWVASAVHAAPGTGA
jgi:S-adenosylmethionine/arginine decarboxylase-like enzyme